jgi:hypothetical protein
MNYELFLNPNRSNYAEPLAYAFSTLFTNSLVTIGNLILRSSICSFTTENNSSSLNVDVSILFPFGKIITQ